MNKHEQTDEIVFVKNHSLQIKIMKNIINLKKLLIMIITQENTEMQLIQYVIMIANKNDRK